MEQKKRKSVLRNCVQCGRHPYKQDFATWIINKLKQNQEITVVKNHFNISTLADNLATIQLKRQKWIFMGYTMCREASE